VIAQPRDELSPVRSGGYERRQIICALLMVPRSNSASEARQIRPSRFDCKAFVPTG